MNRYHYIPLMLLSILAASSITGCTTISESFSPEQIVQQRAQERLDALLEKDWETAWSYTTPAYRDRNPDYRYYLTLIGGAASWTEGTVDKVECKDQVCDVELLIAYPLRFSKRLNRRSIEEKWIQVDGQWWIYHKN